MTLTDPHYVIEKDVMLSNMLVMQLNEVRHSGNIHIAQYNPGFVSRLIQGADNHRNTTELHGYKVRLFSNRYLQFEKSRECVSCGVVGQIMCLDTKPGDKKHGRAHFNLYGIMPSGRVVMLTKDHIKPKAAGGLNRLDNYQTMCETCNHAKGDGKPKLHGTVAA